MPKSISAHFLPVHFALCLIKRLHLFLGNAKISLTNKYGLSSGQGVIPDRR